MIAINALLWVALKLGLLEDAPGPLPWYLAERFPRPFLPPPPRVPERLVLLGKLAQCNAILATALQARVVVERA